MQVAGLARPFGRRNHAVALVVYHHAQPLAHGQGHVNHLGARGMFTIWARMPTHRRIRPQMRVHLSPCTHPPAHAPSPVTCTHTQQCMHSQAHRVMRPPAHPPTSDWSCWPSTSSTSSTLARPATRAQHIHEQAVGRYEPPAALRAQRAGAHGDARRRMHVMRRSRLRMLHRRSCRRCRRGSTSCRR